MKYSLAILHCFPIEKYPPIINLISFLDEQQDLFNKIILYTSSDHTKKEVSSYSIKIKRNNLYKYKLPLKGFITQFHFHFTTFIHLCITRPDIVFYYEHVSALSAILYKFFKPRVRLFIHSHELYTFQERKGTILSSFILFFEKYGYEKAEWISHTNIERLSIFADEFHIKNENALKVMPNYPSIKWPKKKKPKTIEKPIRLVYIGSFASFETLYIKEFLTWMKEQSGNALLDIYSFHIPAEIVDFVKGLNTPNISIKGSLDYIEIPNYLRNYDIGIILYKGTTLNFIHNVPNKLFEYSACDLDVWFPNEMLGCYPYITSSTIYPKIVSIDFKKLDKLNIDQTISRDGLNYSQTEYISENVYRKIVNQMLNNY